MKTIFLNFTLSMRNCNESHVYNYVYMNICKAACNNLKTIKKGIQSP